MMNHQKELVKEINQNNDYILIEESIKNSPSATIAIWDSKRRMWLRPNGEEPLEETYYEIIAIHLTPKRKLSITVKDTRTNQKYHGSCKLL